MGLKAVLFVAAFALAAFSACGPRGRGEAGEPASANNAATSQAEADVPAQMDLNITMYVNATSGLRVRGSPDAGGEILGALEHLAQVHVVRGDINTATIDDVEGRWVYISSPIAGWVFDGFLENAEWRMLVRFPEHARNAAMEFLRGLRIVSDPAIRIEMRDDGSFAAFDATWQEVEMELPHIGEYGIAHEYRLFDLNDDGILEIQVVWDHGMRVGVPFATTLHVYSNGEYMEVFVIDGPSFYRCDQGYIYLQGGSWGYNTLYRLVFGDEGLQQIIRTMDFEDSAMFFGMHGEIFIHGNGITRFLYEGEFDALVESGDWEHLRGDFPEFALWLDRRDSLRPILPLELDLFAEN